MDINANPNNMEKQMAFMLGKIWFFFIVFNLWAQALTD